MARTRKPERYAPEFFELTLAIAREGRVEIPCATLPEALGLRTKLYAFWSALDGAASGPEGLSALAKRLVAAQRLPATLSEAESSQVLEAVSELLAGAANAEAGARLSGDGIPRLVIESKSTNRFARLVRAALDARKPGSGVEASLARLKSQIGGQDE